MISGYSIYLLCGLVALMVLTCISGVRFVPLPPSAPLRIYIVMRTVFGQLLAAWLAWIAGRQLLLGSYILLAGTYQVVLLAYYSHFHFIPSLRLLFSIRREAIAVSKELLNGGFLILEFAILLVYSGVFALLHVLYASITGEYLEAILFAVAPGAAVAFFSVLGLGILWTLRGTGGSVGQLFSYHNMLRVFGPLSWQVMYSFARHERSEYNRSLPQVRIAGRSRAGRRDIVFVQLESVGARMVQAEHAGRPVMPNLSRWEKEGVYFPRVVSAKGRGGTSDVELAMFTGRTHGASDAPMLDEYYDYGSSIFLALRSAGYKTFAFHGNTGAFFKRSLAYEKMGTDFYDQRRMGLRDAGWGAADGDVLEFAQRQLVGECSPVAAGVILMTGHTPFTNINAIKPPPPGGQDTMFDRYCRSLAYVDAEVDSFVRRYRQAKPDAVIVVYGDHGARVQGHVVNDTVLHEGTKRDLVPAWILANGLAPATWQDEITMPTLAATALALLGLELEIKTEGVPLDLNESN